ncbi:hypothetical protein DCAR_0104602 [Daucus carota subsp. sativus]|uniref:Transmembrane protein n=2 Tax=Daucus carota subsp. sativus TaxID=79200 RepID=A0AAF0W905_DAUCS|nr:PREDICTED: uncharacterized protein LOC108193817 [Daucus carota subsp. sativus]WOG85414.1 hypothetical protein DCAR_0104602 [Daucus carota subsp. sativus]
MHRQSLSSPNSKLHTPHGGLLSHPSTNNIDLTANDSHLAAAADVDDLRKSQKPQKSAEKLIHIIPMLIVFCFLVLYLSSHDPSQKEVTSFNGFKRNSKPIDVEISSEIDDFGGLLETKKSDILAIGSMRNLQEIHKKRSQNNHRVHRKFADF